MNDTPPPEMVEYAQAQLTDCPTLGKGDLRGKLREKFKLPVDMLRAAADVGSGPYLIGGLIPALVFWPLIGLRNLVYTHPRDRRIQEIDAVVRQFFPGAPTEPTKPTSKVQFDPRLARVLLYLVIAVVALVLLILGILEIVGP
jgi:hypothetical protein